MTRRVALYTRVSTDLQAAGDNNSLDMQESRLRGAVTARKGEHQIVEVFREEGASGKSVDRPQLQRMMAAVVAGDFDLIIVVKIDRFTRSLPDFYRLHEILEAHDVALQALDNSFDTTTAQGRAFLNMILVFAQLEREQTGERTRASMRERARKGLYIGGRPMLGYDKGKDGRLEINEAEASVVRIAFEKFAELRAAPALARWLNEQGHRQKRYIPRRTGLPSGGKPFTAATVRSMLRNQVYLGHMTYKDTIIGDTHAAIIDTATFSRAASILEANGKNQRTPPPTSPKRVYLLTGLARCECGGALSPHPSRKYHYYRCVAVQKKSEAGHQCAVKQVGALALERAVVRLMRDAARQQGLIEAAVEEANKLACEDLEPARARLVALKADLRRVKDEAQRMILALAHQGVEQSGFAGELLADLEAQAAQLRSAIAEQEGAIQALDSRHVDLEVVRQALQDFDSCFDLLTDAEKQEFLGLMVRRVVVHPDEVEIEVYEGQSFSAKVEGLKRKRGGKNARVNTDEVNADDTRNPAPEQQKGTEPGSEDPRFRAQCVLAPRR